MSRSVHLRWSADVEPAVAELLPERLAQVLACPVRQDGGFSLLAEEFHAGRRQYRASTVLRRLRPLRPAGACLLAVTGDDLFAAGLNFVFGEADVRGGCAIISLARLRAPYLGFALTTERLLRRTLIEAVHEVGHLLGLDHCPQSDCVMHFSNSLADTDRKTPDFCPRCRQALRGTPGSAPTERLEKKER
jgi:archaemetzincin